MSAFSARLPQRAKLLASIDKVGELSQAGEHREALALAHATAAAAEAEGFGASCHVLWGLAVIYDNLGMMEESLRYCLKALEIDVLHPGLDHSLRIILNHCDLVLTRSFPWNEKGAALYGTLMEAGLASSAVRALGTKMAFEGHSTPTTQFGSVTRGVA